MKSSRKEFLTGTLPLGGALLLGGGIFSGCEKSTGGSQDLSTEEPVSGPVTLYYEFRIAQPEVKEMLRRVQGLIEELKGEASYAGASLKRMIGESTMVKNFPESYKGMLNTAYEDGAREKTLPLFYAFFLRFGDGVQAQRKMNGWFEANIAPLLHIYNPKQGKTPSVFDYHSGIYRTVVAGNRSAIFQEEKEILEFMASQEDEPSRGLVTVGNQVGIDDANQELFEKRIVDLLKTAQKTYQPEANPENGNPGAADNRFYRSAVTTEILKNVRSAGGMRSYIMHGTWESYWDHENSHLDERFKKASMPVGSLVIQGPFEPFYLTELLASRASLQTSGEA